MSIKLRVYKGKEHDPYLESEFNQVYLKIGREESNNIILEDKKKIISREHAYIKFEDGKYYLIDNGSHNGTFINKSRLKPHNPYIIDNSSEISLGDYKIKIALTEVQNHKKEETNILPNPYLEYVHLLSGLLTSIERIYDEDDSNFRDEFLKSACVDEDIYLKKNIIFKVLLHEERQIEDINKCSNNTSFMNQILDILLEMLINLSKVIFKFRAEFVGTTHIQTKDNLQMDSKNKLMSHLLDPNLTIEQFQRRISNLKKEVNRIIIHQVAVLDGYSGSIQEGIQELLKEFNPAIIKKELQKQSIKFGPIKLPLRFIPFHIKAKTLMEIQSKIYNLTSENRGVLEKKYFRPKFIRRYLENFSSSQNSSSIN